MHCNGGFQEMVGPGLWRCVLGEWHGRFPWWCGINREFHWK